MLGCGAEPISNATPPSDVDHPYATGFFTHRNFLGELSSQGTIERGKIANLVLLEADPLENIRNTERINAVVLNGRYLPKETLQKMIAEVEGIVDNK